MNFYGRASRVKLALIVIIIMMVTAVSLPVSAESEPHDMLLGVHEQYQGKDATTPDATKGRYPLIDITREFKSGTLVPQNLIPSVRNLCTKVWDAGLTCNVSFKLNPDDVFNGKWRIYIEQLCRYIVENGKASRTVLTWWHEPEDDAADSFPTNSPKGEGKAFANGEQFTLYFNTLHEWMKGVSPTLVDSHAALGYGYRPKRGGPGDDSAWVQNPAAWITKADIHSIDIYSGRSFPLGMNLDDSPAFNRWYESRPFIPMTGYKKWAVSERGWTAPDSKSKERVNSIRAEFEWLNSLTPEDRPVFYIVWLTEGTESDHALKPDEAMRDAINEGFTLLRTPPTKPEKPTDQECPLCKGSGRVPLGEAITITKTVTVGGNG